MRYLIKRRMKRTTKKQIWIVSAVMLLAAFGLSVVHAQNGQSDAVDSTDSQSDGNNAKECDGEVFIDPALGGVNCIPNVPGVPDMATAIRIFKAKEEASKSGKSFEQAMAEVERVSGIARIIEIDNEDVRESAESEASEYIQVGETEVVAEHLEEIRWIWESMRYQQAPAASEAGRRAMALMDQYIASGDVELLLQLVPELHIAAEQDDALAMNWLLFFYYGGLVVPEDKERAVEYARRAAEQKDPWGLAQLGNAYEDGYGGYGQDIDKALALYEEAAALGGRDALNTLGVAYFKGNQTLNIQQNKVKGLEYLERASAAGNTMSMQVALADYQITSLRDPKTQRLATQLCDSHTNYGAFGCGVLGYYYSIAENDTEQARHWYMRGWQQGRDIHSAAGWGTHLIRSEAKNYEDIEQGDVDDRALMEEARLWLQRGCGFGQLLRSPYTGNSLILDLSPGIACINLAALESRYGNGDVTNYRAAERAYLEAIDKEAYIAHRYLALLHRQGGPGFPADITKSVAFLRQGAETYEDSATMNDLAYNYILGRGVQQDHNVAEHWLKRSAEKGFRGAFVTLGFLYARAVSGVENNPSFKVNHYQCLVNGHLATMRKRLWQGQRLVAYCKIKLTERQQQQAKQEALKLNQTLPWAYPKENEMELDNG